MTYIRPTITDSSTILLYHVIYFTPIYDDRTMQVLTIPRSELNTDESTHDADSLHLISSAALCRGIKYIFPA